MRNEELLGAAVSEDAILFAGSVRLYRGWSSSWLMKAQVMLFVYYLCFKNVLIVDESPSPAAPSNHCQSKISA